MEGEAISPKRKYVCLFSHNILEEMLEKEKRDKIDQWRLTRDMITIGLVMSCMFASIYFTKVIYVLFYIAFCLFIVVGMY